MRAVDHFTGAHEIDQDRFRDGIARAGELHLQGVTVERAQALDRSIVVKLAGRTRGVHDGTRADDQISARRRTPASQVGIEPTHDRVDEIRGDELAWLAFEGGIVREIDSRLD